MSVRFAKLNLRCVRGCRWDDDITLVSQTTEEPVSLADIADLHLVAREEYNGPELFRLSLGAGNLVVVDAAAGTFGIRAIEAKTLEFPENDHEQARYVYDTVIERTAGAYEPGVAGAITVDPVSARVWEDA